MAEVTMLNSQITDAVTQSNVKVVAEAPAIAMGNLYQATAQALGNAAHNATNGQQLANITSQAATLQGVNTLLAVDTAAEAAAVAKINQSDLPQFMSGLLAVVQAFTGGASKPVG